MKRQIRHIANENIISVLDAKKAHRTCVSEGVKVLEIARAHARDDRKLENRTRGLPKHVKEK